MYAHAHKHERMHAYALTHTHHHRRQIADARETLERSKEPLLDLLVKSVQTFYADAQALPQSGPQSSRHLGCTLATLTS